MTTTRGSGSSLIGILKHPLWISLGTLIAIAGLVVAFVEIRQTEKPASVKVSAVTFGNPQSIDAVTYATYDKVNRTPISKNVAPVDITLTNSGDKSLRIVSIHARVLDAKTVNCNFQGGGIAVSAEYSISVPYNPWQMKATSTSVSNPVDFKLNAQSSDRMRVTIGPSEEGNGYPVVIAVQLTLIPDSGEPIQIQPLAVVQPDAAEFEIKALQKYTGSGVIDTCVAQAQSTLADIYAITRTQSPGVDYLRDQLPGAV